MEYVVRFSYNENIGTYLTDLMLQEGLIRVEFKPVGHKVFLLLAVAVIKHCGQALLGTVA